MCALLIILVMLKLAFWQLSRAEQKRVLLDQTTERANQASLGVLDLLNGANGFHNANDFHNANGFNNVNDSEQLRYRNVYLNGHYLVDKSIYVDNHVLNGQVGYLVFTPFQLAGVDEVVMVNRGWLPVGDSRQTLPAFITPENELVLKGRLNKAPAKPPLWNDAYPVAQGKVWAYLPLEDYASQMQLKLLPLVVELAPQALALKNDADFIVQWPTINDEWVAKHQGYAFQWFMMAIVFFIACLVLLLRHLKKRPDAMDNISE